MRLKFFAVLLHGASAITCYNCNVKYDHNGNLIEGSDNCWSADGSQIDLDDKEIACKEPNNFCKTEVIVEWQSSGEQTINFNRGCAAASVSEENACIGSTLSGNNYRDCRVTCNSDNCNGDSDVLELLGKTDEDDNSAEIRCAQCSSLRDDYSDTEEDYCKNNDRFESCPPYANHGCFNAHEIIDIKTENVTEEYFKGCSFFEINEETVNENKCNIFTINGDTAQTCKNECDEDECNSGPLENTKVCNVCEYAFDHYGEQLSIGDPDCMDRLSTRHLQTCREGVTTCVTEFDAVWGFNGKQEFALRRGCGQTLGRPPLEEDCLTANANSQFHAKQCMESCENDGLACNSNLDVLEEFGGQVGAVDSCRVCRSTLDNPESEGDCSEDLEKSKECPSYANAACFSSSVVEDTLLGYKQIIHHGCSAFRTSKDELVCFNAEYEIPSFGNPSGETETNKVCKETCQDNDCNINLSKPVVSEHYCYVCEVRVNHLNQTIGLGDFHCLDDPPSIYELECPETQTYCRTELEVDWMPNGDQETTVRRSCSETPAPTSCSIGNPYGSIYQRKDCASTCTNNLISGCNNNLMEVAQKFADDLSGDQVQSCYNCETHPGQDDCRLEQGADGENVSSCPLYANAGCFTSASRIREDQKGELDIIRGCSTFQGNYNCYDQNFISWDDESDQQIDNKYTTCKETCSGDNCNSEKAVIKSGNSCHVCRVVMDHNGDVIGTGSADCLYLDEVADYDIVDCGEESSCATHMEIAWLPFGQQEILVERKCDVPNAIDNLCTERTTNGWLEKDCWEHCYEDLCNDDLDIARNFAPAEGTVPVTECYSCSYEQIGTNNPLDDEFGCLENPVESTKQDCPIWAQLGCFVGDGVQKDLDNNLSVNVHRGCSSFVLEEDQLCGSLTLDTNVTEEVERSRISVCKVTCTDSDDCNTFRYPDWVEPPGNECPPGLCEPVTTSSTQSTISSSSTVSSSSTESTQSSTDSSTVSSTDSTISSSSTVSSSSTESSTVSSTVSSIDSTMSSSSSESTASEDSTTIDEVETDVGLILGATALALTVTAIGGAGVFFFCTRKSSKTNPDKI